eukprot:IDg15986t1
MECLKYRLKRRVISAAKLTGFTTCDFENVGSMLYNGNGAIASAYHVVKDAQRDI